MTVYLGDRIMQASGALGVGGGVTKPTVELRDKKICRMTPALL